MKLRFMTLGPAAIILGLLVAFATPPPIGGQASSVATIYGTVVAYWVHDYRPAQGITIYLLRAEKSVALTRLQQEGCRRINRPGISKYEANEVGERYLNNAIALISDLPHISKTKTDKRGRYRFPNVPVGKAYKVVAFEPYEDHEYFEIRTTGVLKPSEKLQIDLDERDPWWEIKCEPEAKGR
jgi:hypothetical protein